MNLPIFHTDNERTFFVVEIPIQFTFKNIKKTTPQVTPQVEMLVQILRENGELGRIELMKLLALKDRMHFMNNYLQPALEAELIEYTIPDKPKSSLQKYRLKESEKT